jgi:hypothetical protein
MVEIDRHLPQGANDVRLILLVFLAIPALEHAGALGDAHWPRQRLLVA